MAYKRVETVPSAEISAHGLTLLSLCGKETSQVVKALRDAFNKCGKRDFDRDFEDEKQKAQEGLSEIAKAAYEACLADMLRGISAYWARCDKNAGNRNGGESTTVDDKSTTVDDKATTVDDKSTTVDQLNKEVSNKGNKETNKEREKQTAAPPTLDEIKRFVGSEKLNIDAERFLEYYTEHGWPKDWHAKARRWDKTEYGTQPKKIPQLDYTQREYEEPPDKYTPQWLLDETAIRDTLESNGLEDTPQNRSRIKIINGRGTLVG